MRLFNLKTVALVAAACLLSVGSVQAASIAITNPGFDYTTNSSAPPTTNTPGYSNGCNDTTASPFAAYPSGDATEATTLGWITSAQANGGVQGLYSASYWYAGSYPGDGNSVGYVSYSTMSSTPIVGALLPNTTYTLTATIYRRASDPYPGAANIFFSLQDGAGTNLPSQVLTVVDPDGTSPGSMTLTVTTASDQAAGDLKIFIDSLAGGYNQFAFDNITLSNNVVPEPSTLALLAAGLLGLLCYAWRKRK